MVEVFTISIENEPQYEGTEDQPIQIDKPVFSGTRKYNRGLLRKGDLLSHNEGRLYAHRASEFSELALSKIHVRRFNVYFENII